VWSSIGLYPVAGSTRYYIGSPLFTKSTLHLEGGHTFTIAAPAASPRNIYVVGVRLNGHRLNRFVLEHDEIARGGHLDLEMADRALTRGTIGSDH
jgi:putative alpha-1,2-mannosidase